MKFRNLKRFFFVLIVATIFLFATHLIDTYFFVNYDLSEFAVGFFACFITGCARGWFNQKFPRTDGKKEFSYDNLFVNEK